MDKIKISIPRHSQPRTALTLAGLLFLLVLIGPQGWDQRAQAKEEAVQIPYTPTTPGRHFYITNENVFGSQAAGACSTGYHMASLWEIYQVSGLIYDKNHPDAKVRTDNGSGPTSGWWGWARTGNDSSVENIAGKANCSNWTSSTGGQYGTIVRLTESWMQPASAISPWEAIAWSCAGTAPVWCVGDFHAVYLPIMIR